LGGNAANIHFDDKSSGLSNPATDDKHRPKDTGFWRILLYIYVLLQNNVVIRKKVNEKARTAANTM